MARLMTINKRNVIQMSLFNFVKTFATMKSNVCFAFSPTGDMDDLHGVCFYTSKKTGKTTLYVSNLQTHVGTCAEHDQKQFRDYDFCRDCAAELVEKFGHNGNKPWGDKVYLLCGTMSMNAMFDAPEKAAK